MKHQTQLKVIDFVNIGERIYVKVTIFDKLHLDRFTPKNVETSCNIFSVSDSHIVTNGTFFYKLLFSANTDFGTFQVLKITLLINSSF